MADLAARENAVQDVVTPADVKALAGAVAPLYHSGNTHSEPGRVGGPPE
jgi:hypothetical protein